MSFFYSKHGERSVKIYDPKQDKLVEEQIYGKTAMLCFYGNPIGIWATTKINFHSTVSKFFGKYNSSAISKRKIKPFVKKFAINMDECQKQLHEFTSFNDFFARKLKPTARVFSPNPKNIITPGDGRLLVFPQIDKNTLAFVKWAPIKLIDIFGGDKICEEFEGGACAVLRLCPTDYHRFHFPADGIIGKTTTIAGELQSVHPFALENKIPVFCTNKRTLAILESNSVGKIALLEIGALLVGSIVQTHAQGSAVERGQEKGYFEFGGSTCILFFQKNKIVFDKTLIDASNKGIETLVKLGDKIAEPV